MKTFVYSLVLCGGYAGGANWPLEGGGGGGGGLQFGGNLLPEKSIQEGLFKHRITNSKLNHYSIRFGIVFMAKSKNS